MDEKKAKELTDSIFDKLNDQERVYLAWVHNQKNKEIERLKSRLEEYQEYVEINHKEIERLNNIIKEQGLEDKPNYYVKGLEGSLKEYQEEIERLNNIINELEKTLLEWHEYWEDDDSYSWQYKNAYDYLQELKGDDKE